VRSKHDRLPMPWSVRRSSCRRRAMRR
jgi:hypothetical protein